MKNWNEVEPGSAGGMYVNESGTYVWLIEEAWDSLFALPGTKDYDQYDGKHFIGLFAKVVAPVDSPQCGKGLTIRIWANSDKAQSSAKGVFERLGLEFAQDVAGDDPLSVSELVNRYFTGVAEWNYSRDESGKKYLNIAPWFITEPPEEFTNSIGELRADKENKISVEHYKRELNSKTETEKEKSASVPETDEIPF